MASLLLLGQLPRLGACPTESDKLVTSFHFAFFALAFRVRTRAPVSRTLGLPVEYGVGMQGGKAWLDSKTKSRYGGKL